MSSMAFDPAQALAGLGGGDPSAAGGDAGAQPDTGAGITSSMKGDSLDDLRQALLFLQSYQEKEQDDQDIAAVGKIAAQLQAILAKDSKEQDAAAGVTDVHRGMAKAYARSGQGGAGGSY